MIQHCQNSPTHAYPLLDSHAYKYNMTILKKLKKELKHGLTQLSDDTLNIIDINNQTELWSMSSD
jgi:hypothetical protein